MDNSLRVSVILPVHNGARFLAAAVRHIQQQNYQPLEIIVVDDGSTDHTAVIAAQLGDQIRYVYQSNQGPAAARNRGIELAEGDVITFLDVDDLWAEGILTEAIAYLAAHPEVEIVQGLIQQMQLISGQLEASDSPVFEPVFEPYQFINLGSAVYRRSVIDQVGLLDEALWDNEDTDWFVRIWEQNITRVVLPKVMLFYRKHDRNMTLDQQDLPYYGIMKVYQRRIARARNTNQHANQPAPRPTIPWSQFAGNPPNPLVRSVDRPHSLESC